MPVGVIHNFSGDGGFDYLAAPLCPTRRYAVFTHAGHVSRV